MSESSPAQPPAPPNTLIAAWSQSDWPAVVTAAEDALAEGFEGVSDVHLARVAALLRLQRAREALDAVSTALARWPGHPLLRMNRAIARSRLGLWDEACTELRSLLPDPTVGVQAAIELSALLIAWDREAEALTVIDTALPRVPDNPQLLINRAAARLGSGDHAGALAAYRALPDALAGLPQTRLGMLQALLHLGEFPAALTLLQSLDTDLLDEDVVDDVANALVADLSDGVLEARLATLRTQLPTLWPDLVLRVSNALLVRQWQPQTFARARQVFDQDDTGRRLAAFGEALIQIQHGRLTEADEALALGRQGDPDGLEHVLGSRHYPRPAESWIARQCSAGELALAQRGISMLSGHWSLRAALPQLAADLQARLAQGRAPVVSPFEALELPFSPALRQAVARGYARAVKAVAPATLPAVTPAARAHRSRIRIGYLSGDFRHHPLAHNTQAMYALHDRTQFEVFAYSARASHDAYAQRIAADCDRFVDVEDNTPEELAARIRADEIDILVDLSGYTTYCRTESLAARPAPVQVNYQGFPGTLGADFVDYIVLDPVVLPEADREWVDEQPVLLPESYFMLAREPIGESGIGRADEGLPADAFVFCCMNHARKLEPESFDLWLALLQHVPGSVLWLLQCPESTRTMLRQRAAAAGIDSGRLIFAERRDKPVHLERLRLADLFLDTFTYNAHATAADALWSGLPVVTLKGRGIPARVCASLLTALGRPDLITESHDDYLATALALAQNPDRLAALRADILTRRLSSPLFDTERRVRHLEQAYRSMWTRFLSGERAQPIAVPALPRRP